MNTLTTVTFTNGTSVQLHSVFGNTTVSSEFLMNKEEEKRDNGIEHAYFGYTLEDMESYIKKTADEQVELFKKIPEKFKQEFIEIRLSRELEELC